MAESTILTGQFVRISQTPASIGERIIALIIDYVLIGFYMTTLVFMPLALPVTHPFWSDQAAEWTSQKAWSGKPFPIDGHHSLRNEK